MSTPWLTFDQGVRVRIWFEAALRGAGFEVCSFYGSGSDPQAGWVRCWWAERACVLHVVPHRPYEPRLAEDFMARLAGVVERCGLVPASGDLGWTLGAFNRALDLEWQLQQATHRIWEWSPVDWGYASGDLVLCDAEHGGYRLERGGSVLMPWVMPRDGEGLAGEDQAAFHVRLAGRVAVALRGAGAS
jgi:hypothetical protein